MPPNELSIASRLVSASASGALANNCSTTLSPGAVELGELHHLVHQPDAARLLGAEALAGQRIAAHLAHADGIAELRNDDRRGEAPAYLGDREQRVVGRDHDVAGCNGPVPPPKQPPCTSATVGTGTVEPLHGLQGRARHRLVLFGDSAARR